MKEEATLIKCPKCGKAFYVAFDAGNSILCPYCMKVVKPLTPTQKAE